MAYKKQLNKEELAEKREEQAAQLKEITEKLEQGVMNVYSSDEYKNFLNMLAKFPRYSVNNNILIMLQRPDAQMCQSFTGWKAMGRYVKQGEVGIKILAPSPYKVHKERDKVDENGEVIRDENGEVVKETETYQVSAFKVVRTFDVSQTEGKELPSVGVHELSGDIADYDQFLNNLKEICPVPVSFESFPGAAKGYFSRVENCIVVRSGMSQLQTIKTLIHEMAHQKLHSAEVPGQEKTREQKEVEAESVAYTMCQHYGLDTSDYSFAYVATWSNGKELPELKASLETIRQAASDMILAVDEKMEMELPDKKEISVEDKTQDPNYLAIISKEDAAQLSCKKIYEFLQNYQTSGDMALFPKVKENVRVCPSDRVRCIINELEIKLAEAREMPTTRERKERTKDSDIAI